MAKKEMKEREDKGSKYDVPEISKLAKEQPPRGDSEKMASSSEAGKCGSHYGTGKMTDKMAGALTRG